MIRNTEPRWFEGVRFRTGVLLLAFAVLPAMSAWSQRLQQIENPIEAVAYPNIIVYNGKIMTMDDTSLSESLGTVAEAMAVRDGYIVALGKSDDVLKTAGPKTLKINLKGRTVLPGLINSHIHIQYAVANEFFRDHPEAYAEVVKPFQVQGKTYDELRQGIQMILTKQMVNTPPDLWAIINLPRGDLGSYFLQDHNITKKDLDAWAPKTPVMLRSGMYMVNTAGLTSLSDLTGTGDIPTIPDDDGMGAMLYYDRVMVVNAYFRSQERISLLANLLADGMTRHAADGVTTWESAFEGVRFWDAFKELATQDRMPIRFAYTARTGFWDNMDAAGFFRRLGDQEDLGTNYFWSAGISYGSMDAAAPEICTTMEAPMDVRKHELCKADSDKNGKSMMNGFYWAIRNHHRAAFAHIAGDKAATEVLGEVERAVKDDPAITLDYVRSRHFTMDHCTFYPKPDQLPEIAKLGMIMSCQAGFDGRARTLAKYFNMSYANWASPIKSMIAAGIPVAYESNSPGNTGHSYFEGGISLMTRKTSDGTLMAPQEAIDRNIMAKMMTSWASEFVGKPNVIGTLEPGKFADFIILNKDYFTVPMEDVPQVHTVLTAVGGKIVSLRAELATELGMQPVGPQYDYDHPKSGEGIGGGD